MGTPLVGAMLRERRESLGISLDQAASMTNIRARVLEVFENSDYEKYPPKGYAKGMLSSYARSLGMDPRPILSGYQIEFDHYSQKVEIEEGARFARSGKDTNGFKRVGSPSSRGRTGSFKTAASTGSMEAVPGSTDTAGDIARAHSGIKVISKANRTSGGHRVTTAKDLKRKSAASTGNFEAYKQSMKNRYENGDAAESSVGMFRNSNAATTGRLSTLVENTGSFAPLERPASSDDDLPMDDDYDLRGGGKRRPRSRTSSSKSSHKKYSSQITESLPKRIISAGLEGLQNKQTRLIVIAVVCVIAALILVASLLLSTAGSDNAGIMDVSGGAGTQSVTEQGTDKKTGAAIATVTTANGNPVIVSVDVPQGKTTLLDITYDDDKAYDGTAVGPLHREFQVTKSFEASIGTVESVTVEENGTPLDIPASEDGSGSLEITVQASGLASGKNQ